MKFRTKTIIGVALIQGALLAFLGWHLVGQLERSNREAIARRVDTTSRLLMASVRDAMISYDLATLESVSDEILGTGELAYLRIEDAQQNLLLQRGDLPPASPAPGWAVGGLDAQIFDQTVPVVVQGQRFGVIRFGFDTAPFQQMVRETRQSTLIVAALVMLLVALFSYVLGTYLTRQLQRLRQSSVAVAEGDLQHSLEVEGDDELAETAAAYNHMLRKLREADDERRRQDTALREALAAAEAASVAKSRFLAVMSHEIRTPMNGVLGMAQLLAMSTLDDDQREQVEVIRSSGDALLGLINDILEFSKIEAGKVELEWTDFDLQAELDSLVALLRPMAEQKGLALQAHWPAPLPTVHGDRLRLRQVLLNLVSNALKFTAQGSVSVRARLLPLADAGWRLEVEVQDTGIGIPAERRERLFKPFSQVDVSTTRQFGGTGLGLAISERLCALMGGHIEVESQAGHGSTFRFSVLLQTAQAPLPTQVPQAPAVDAKVQGLRVLVAEDNAPNQQFVMTLLQRMGCPATLARNGREAWTLAQGGGFDVVLMDLQMPEMDGIEATRRIRASGLARQPYIIALTANSYETDRDNCRQAGMDDFISKPFRTHELRQMLEWVADRQA